MPPALPRLGASLPLPPDLTMCRRVAERAEALGYESIWIADTGAGPDAFVVGATAALATRRVRIGTAVVPIYTRALPVLAAGAGSCAQLLPGRSFVLRHVPNELRARPRLTAWRSRESPYTDAKRLSFARPE